MQDRTGLEILTTVLSALLLLHALYAFWFGLVALLAEGDIDSAFLFFIAATCAGRAGAIAAQITDNLEYEN